MSDSLQTYDVGKIDALVAESVGVEDKVDMPEEIQTQLAGETEPEVDLERDLDVLQRLDPNFINDPVRLYLREIAETPLLTHVQEIDLDQSDRYRTTWPYFRDRRIDSYQPITKRYIDD